MGAKRILIYGLTDNIGGMEVYILNYFRNINRNKLMFDFVTDYPEIAFKDELIKMGSRIFYIPKKGDSIIKQTKAFRKILKDNPEYDTVYFQDLSAIELLDMGAVILDRRIKKIVHSHNTSVSRKKLHYLCRPFLSFFSDSKLACSREAAHFMFGNSAKDEVKIIHNAIDAAQFSYDSQKRDYIRKKLNIEDKFVIGNIGRFAYQKNHSFLIDIFYKVYQLNKNARLMLIGVGGLEDNIKAKVQDLGISEVVFFMGARNDIAMLTQAMDVFLFPSHFEGLGIVAIEAQAAGLKTIVSDVVPQAAGITDLIEYIPLSKSDEYWAKQVLKHAKGYPRRDTYKEIVNARYDIKHEAHRLEEVLLEN